MPGSYQRKDHHYRKAKSEGYRSRAAYKLEELDQRCRLFSKVQSVVDLGCAPGGWLQYSANRLGSAGRVIGVDLLDVPNFKQDELAPNVAAPQVIKGDMRDPVVHEKIKNLAGGKVDLCLSDMSPNLSGIRERDTAAAIELVENAFTLAKTTLQVNGNFAAKIFPDPEVDELYRKYSSSFAKMYRIHLKSTRKTSREFYFVGKGFSG